MVTLEPDALLEPQGLRVTWIDSREYISKQTRLMKVVLTGLETIVICQLTFATACSKSSRHPLECDRVFVCSPEHGDQHLSQSVVLKRHGSRGKR